MIEMQTTLKRNPELLAVDMDGETVMMDMISGNYFGINTVGSYIWELLEDKQTVETVINSIESHFEVKDGDTPTDDILAFLREMQQQQLVEVLNA